MHRDFMETRTKILFVCHGNICRSPMAEFVMKDMAAKRGVSDRFEIDSAATSREEIGNPVYPPARRKLAENGIGCSGPGCFFSWSCQPSCRFPPRI